MNEPVTLSLPYPPTANHYWKRFRNRYFISAKGTAFRTDVMAEVLGTGVKKICGPVKVSIRLHPPDAKRRDLDNIFKPLMDALMFAAVIEDDSNVKWIDAKFLGKVAGGRVDVCVESIEDFKYL